MTRRLIQNFRGVNALVIHAEDRNRTILTETLTRLGLKIHVSDPSDAAAIRDGLNEAEIVVFDTDMVEGVALASAGERITVPTIAIVGLEAPGRLQRAFELEPSAILYKPLRSTGHLFGAVLRDQRAPPSSRDRAEDAASRGPAS